MPKSRLLLVLALILLAASVFLLLWGLWPLAHQLRLLPLPPNTISLPTPSGFLPGPLPAC